MTPFREKRDQLRYGCVLQTFAAPSLCAPGTGLLSPADRAPFDVATPPIKGRFDPETIKAWRKALGISEPQLRKS